MGVVNKTGVMVPRISLVNERSQILARVQDDLNVERIRIQQRRSKYCMRTCPQCLESGFRLIMQEWMLKKHLLNHRILRALGNEKEWIQKLRKRYKKRIVKLLKGAKVGRERSKINRIEKAKIRSDWLWQRTILKPKLGQRRKIAWITLRMGEPIWIVPASVWSQSYKCVLPVELARAWEVCHSFVERLVMYDDVISNKSKKVILLVSRWLSASDKKYINKMCYSDEIINKEVILGNVLQFVRWRKK